MNNQVKLIKYREQLLKKVKEAWSSHGVRGEEYISHAEYNLFAAKNGRGW